MIKKLEVANVKIEIWNKKEDISSENTYIDVDFISTDTFPKITTLHIIY
jgi:hypothetical protein